MQQTVATYFYCYYIKVWIWFQSQTCLYFHWSHIPTSLNYYIFQWGTLSIKIIYNIFSQIRGQNQYRQLLIQKFQYYFTPSRKSNYHQTHSFPCQLQTSSFKSCKVVIYHQISKDKQIMYKYSRSIRAGAALVLTIPSLKLVINVIQR